MTGEDSFNLKSNHLQYKYLNYLSIYLQFTGIVVSFKSYAGPW